MDTTATALLRPASALGCCNLRDLGGFPGAGGTRIRHGRLLRSDSLTAASTHDRDWLRRLPLRTVIDLRSFAEIAVSGCFGEKSVRHHHLPMGLSHDGVTRIAWDDADVVAAHYVEVVTTNQGSIAEALAVLTDPFAYPALVHCTLGKDRTGIVVAIVLSLLGVSDDDIVADYTTSGAAIGRMTTRFTTELADHPAQRESVIAALGTCSPDAMRRFLERMRAEFGSAEGYAAAIGLESAPGYLRAALLAD